MATVIGRLTTACCGAGVPPPRIVARFLSWQDAKIRSLDFVISLFSGSAAKERPSIWPGEQPKDEVR